MENSLAATIQAANATLITGGKLDAVGDFFTADYVAHATDQDIAGHGAIRRFLDTLQRGFTDLQVEVEILLEGKDRVAWQRTLRGTQQGDYMGFPATGRQV